MALTTPEITLSLKSFERKDIGTSELALECRTKKEGGDPLGHAPIQIKCESGPDGLKTLFEGVTDADGNLQGEFLISHTWGFRGKIIAVMSGDSPAYGDFVEFPGTTEEIKDYEHALYSPQENTEDEEGPEPEQEQTDEQPGQALSSKAKELLGEIGAEVKTRTVARFSFSPRLILKALLPKSRTYRRFTLLWLGLIGAVGAGVSAKVGLDGADRVTERAKALPMLPIYHKDDERKSYPETYLASKLFLDEDAHTYTAKPVHVEQVMPGGQLHLTRQAIKYAEDNFADYNIGWNPSALKRILTLQGGGSSVHDQVCGAVWEHSGDYEYRSLSPFGGMSHITQKLNQVLCGIGLGLGRRMTSDEVFANYMTFVQLGHGANGVRNFIDRYWGITDLDDSRFTRGHQIVLSVLPAKARLIRFRKESEDGRMKHQQMWEEYIKPAALRNLETMIENGVLLDSDRRQIEREIEDAKPKFYLDTRLSYGSDAETAFIGVLAQNELDVRLEANGMNTPSGRNDWRSSVEGLYVSLDPSLQAVTYNSVTDNLYELPPEVRGTSFTVNDQGEYLAIHTGGADGFDLQAVDFAQRRIDAEVSPGSIGKLIVGAALGKEYARPVIPPKQGGPEVQRASWYLAQSSERLAHSATALGVDDQFIGELIRCYGDTYPDYSSHYLDAAVKGRWLSSSKDLAALTHSLLTGAALPEPHLLVGEINYQSGDKRPYAPAPEKMEKAQCAQKIYQGGRSAEWGSLPFYGTMSDIQKPASVNSLVGKTGTVNADTNGDGIADPRTTNLAWSVLGAKLASGESRINVTFFQSEKIQVVNGSTLGNDLDPHFNIGNRLTAEDLVVPVSKDILTALSR